MLTEERFNLILKKLGEKPAVQVSELTTLLDASESTIRRDLTVLHNQGRLIKVHGGATAIDSNYSAHEDDVTAKQDLNTEDKRRIARHAASLIEPNDMVYIDAGTTTELMAEFITEKNATYITNGVAHAKKLSRAGCRVFMLGGELKQTTEATVGVETVESLRRYNFSKGFFGVNGISLKAGFSTPEINEAMVKTEALRRCRESFVLSDLSKFGKISPVTFGNLTAASIITTDADHEKTAPYGGYTQIIEVKAQ